MSIQDDQDDFGDLDIEQEPAADQDLDDPDSIEDEADEDLPQDEPDSPDAPVDALPPPDRSSRAESRIRTLADENKRKDQQLSDLNRRLDELTRAVARPQQPRGESQEERAARRALMTMEERIAEDQQAATEKTNRDLNAFAFQLQETSDKTTFQALAARDRLAAKWAPKVEEELASIRQQGQNVSRQQLFYYLIGKAAYENRNSPESKRQRRAAATRVARQTTKPANSRSDEAPGSSQRSGTQANRAKRLENIQI